MAAALRQDFFCLVAIDVRGVLLMLDERSRTRFVLPIVIASFAALLVHPSVSRPADLRLEIVDEWGSALPARILVRPAGTSSVVPPDAVVLPIGDERWFFAQDPISLEVPAGRIELRVERGLEYRRSKGELMVPQSGLNHRVVLSRWVDMRSRGYRSGENHLHESTERLQAMLPAEDLDFGSSLSWWNGPDAERPMPKGPQFVRNVGRGPFAVPTSVFDAEVEYDWGAVYLNGGSRQVTLPSDPRLPNLYYVREARRAGAMISYQAGWSREVLLDALLGQVDAVNVVNNLFHMHRFMPRGRYSNLLNVKGFPSYPDTPEGMYRMNTESYYRLLNLGLKLPVGAGSATGAKENPAGFNRSYVRMSEDGSISDFYRAWAAGRNFVTNGPVVELRTRKGAGPGDTVAFEKKGGELQLLIEARADMPLESLEVIVNGEVRRSFNVTGLRSFIQEVPIEVQRGSWIALRATARDDLLSDSELARYSAGSDEELLRVRPNRLRFAHTSPIYVNVGGRGAAVDGAFAEAEAMLDAFENFAMRTAAEVSRHELLKDLASSRANLKKLRSGAWSNSEPQGPRTVK